MKYEEINYLGDFQTLSETDQKDNSLRFSFGDIKDGDTIYNLFPYVRCKDYFNDWFLYREFNLSGKEWEYKEKAIHGFNYKLGVDVDYPLLLVKRKINGLPAAEKIADEFNYWEKKNQTNSIIFNIKNDVHGILVPPFWMKNHILFGIYLSELRFAINVAAGRYSREETNLHHADSLILDTTRAFSGNFIQKLSEFSTMDFYSMWAETEEVDDLYSWHDFGVVGLSDNCEMMDML